MSRVSVLGCDALCRSAVCCALRAVLLLVSACTEEKQQLVDEHKKRTEQDRLFEHSTASKLHAIVEARSSEAQ